MKYDNKVVTKDGITLMTQSISDKAEPIMDKMLVLNTDIPNGKSLEEMNLSYFSNAISFDVNNVSQNDTSFTASAVISNNGINQDYSAKLIGISGYLSNSDNRKLFAVAQASEPFVITRQAETPLTLVPSITIGFSNSSNVQLTVKNDVYVTNQALEDLKNNLITKINNIDLSSATKSANNYTDGQLKNYTNTADLDKKLGGKQSTGDYVTNASLKDQLNQKQDKGLPSGIHLTLSFLNNITNDQYNDLQYSINVDSTNGSTITGYTIYLSNESGYSTNISSNNNAGYISDDVHKDSVCSVYVTVHSNNGDVNSDTQKILIPSNLDNYLDFVINTNADMTSSYDANIVNNNFQYFISKNIKLYVIQTEGSMNSIPDDYIKQTYVLPFKYQTSISNYKSQISDVIIRQLDAKVSTHMNTSSGYYLNGHNGWKVVMYAELLDNYGNGTNIFSKAKLY